MKRWAVAISCWVVFSSSSGYALSFNINDLTGGTQNQALAAFQQAADRWSAKLFDPIIVNIDFDFNALGVGVLASAGSLHASVSLTSVKAQLAADATSADDATAVANLPTGANFDFRTNQDDGTVILDANNSQNNSNLSITSANAKALGYTVNTGGLADVGITFNSAGGFTWDFDPIIGGITAGQYDFVGISTHEIGHALGFVSGVDQVDYYHGSGPGAAEVTCGANSLDPCTVFSVLDLYRYSEDAKLLGGVGTRDFAYGTHPNGLPFFSIDGGITSLGATFETGANQGTGQQASHWRDGLGIGIMDPTFAAGELGIITSLDIQAFDVIGFDLTPIPEPATILLLGTGLLLAYRCKRKQVA